MIRLYVVGYVVVKRFHVEQFISKLLRFILFEITLHVPFFGSCFKGFTIMGRGVASAVHVPPLLPASASHRRTPLPPRKAPILLVFDKFYRYVNLKLSMQMHRQNG